MTKLKETIHFENEEGICKICVELGRQSALKDIEDWIKENIKLGDDTHEKWHEFIRYLNSKLKSATTNEEKEQ
jgi:hypothetical protein